MNHHNLRYLESSRKTAGLWPRFLIGAIGVGVALAGLPAQASESQTPWECSNYTGAAHTRCLEAFVESQRDQIATLQGKVQAQQETVNHMKDQIDRQAFASADLQRQVAQPPAVVQVTPPLYRLSTCGTRHLLGSPLDVRAAILLLPPIRLRPTLLWISPQGPPVVTTPH